MAFLDSDKALMQEVGIAPADDLPKEDKLNFIDAQIDGIRQSMWRSRVDAILNRHIGTKDDKEKAAVLGKVAEHEADVKRYAEAVQLLERIKKEL